MTSTQVIMIIAFLLHASALDSTLSTATALLGMCYGVQYSIMIVLFQQNFYDASGKNFLSSHSPIYHFYLFIFLQILSYNNPTLFLDFSDRLVLKVCVCRRLRKFAKIIGVWYIDDSVYKRYYLFSLL
jgi:hypothetical protein